MGHKDAVMAVTKQLGYVDAEVISPLFPQWKEGASRRNNIYKCLKLWKDLGRLEKHGSYFCLPGLKGKHDSHSRSLTKSLVSFLEVYPDSLIHRELTIAEAGLRPDALILLKHEGKGICIWFEQCNAEKEGYYRAKLQKLQAYDGVLPFLSRLFGYRIPAFTVLRSDQLVSFLEGLK